MCGTVGDMNRLGSATSPYLLQHADNPVDWCQWGEEAMAEARRRDVPLVPRDALSTLADPRRRFATRLPMTWWYGV